MGINKLILPFQRWELWDRAELEFYLPSIIYKVVYGDDSRFYDEVLVDTIDTTECGTVTGYNAAINQYYNRMLEQVGSYIQYRSRHILHQCLVNNAIDYVQLPADTVMIVNIQRGFL